jgi:hypothetical protein
MITQPPNLPQTVPNDGVGFTVDFGSALPPDTSGLTADGLMIYCQTQIGGLDAQIKAYFEKQQQSNATRTAINAVLAQINQHMDGINGDNGVCKSLDATLNDAIAAAGGPKTEIGAQLQQIADLAKQTGSGDDNIISKEEMGKLLDDVKGVQNNINNNSELDMIQLQSLSQKRATALQLCTNLVQSIGDESKQIVGNVGH